VPERTETVTQTARVTAKTNAVTLWLSHFRHRRVRKGVRALTQGPKTDCYLAALCADRRNPGGTAAGDPQPDIKSGLG